MKTDHILELDRQFAEACENNDRRDRIKTEFLNSERLAVNAVSPKQRKLAIAIARDFVYCPHAFRSFAIDDIEAFLRSDRALSHRFWLSCKPDRFGDWAIAQRNAVEKAIAEMKAEESADIKAKRAIAEMSKTELSRLLSKV
jgi:hypothetical protein